jgi:hypothetical protein
MKFTHNVTATIKDEYGNVIREQTNHNAITDGDATSSTYGNGYIFTLMRLFNDDDSSNLLMSPTSYLIGMELGTGTPDDDGLGTPYAGENTELLFDSITWDYSSLPAPKVTASCSWDSGFGALSGVTEAGLYVGDPTSPVSFDELFAYNTFTPALSKTSPGTITITWSITVSA